MVLHITIFTYTDVLDEYCNPELVEKTNLPCCFIQQHYHKMKPPYQQNFFNTLGTGDADLRLYITTVRDG
jgi:hypothetical protein